MLDIHRTASKKMKLDEGATDILKDVFEPVKSILCTKMNKATILIECPEHLIVVVDRLRVKQIILNLAVNSTKFVVDGFIRLRAHVEDGRNVFLFVEDSGPGIRPEQRCHLFSKFQESFDLLSQGTGIGLHISKSLCSFMGADLKLDEDYDSGYGPRNPGARFVVDLRRPQEIVCDDTTEMIDSSYVMGVDTSRSRATGTSHQDDVFSPAVTSIFEQQLHVLFTDDDFILRKLFHRTVKRAAPAWKVDEASNGETALSMTDSKNYDLIFVDQYMASVEKQLLGSETVRALRLKGVSSTICGLSANDLGDTFLECGADAFMLKPFPCEMEKLRRELQRVLLAGIDNGNVNTPTTAAAKETSVSL
jgi:CheY-like chemotaxis protein